MSLQQTIETILQTQKRDGERWIDTIRRLQPLGRVDMKTTIEIQAAILDQIEAINQRIVDWDTPKNPTIKFEGTTLVDKPDPHDRSVKKKSKKSK